ncbi:MAG TPA: DUF2490 domain-containing protein [Chitinophagaceae bacterium]|jgi:hypothetical protein|nr:DUF2490 domain-containing protein [Chitinophagaceae bacterium]
MKQKILLVLFIVSLQHTVFSQSQFSGWLASFNTFKTGKKTSIHFDAQLRSSDEFKQVQTLLLRPGINFHVRKNITLTAGYAFIANRYRLGGITDMAIEHRIWEQVLINQKIKKITLAHRFRMEQRFLPKLTIENGDLAADGHNVMLGRLRYFARGILPLTKTEGSFARGPFVALQNEVFVNIFNKDKVNGKFFDQNRAYLAMGYRLNPKADLEIGYLNQYVNGAGNAFTNNHVVQVAGYLRL